MSVQKYKPISYDPYKREKVLIERGLDFNDAATVLIGWNITAVDDRRDYGEVRYQTVGELNGRIVMIVWTPREDENRIISMRHCHDEEARKFKVRVG